MKHIKIFVFVLTAVLAGFLIFNNNSVLAAGGNNNNPPQPADTPEETTPPPGEEHTPDEWVLVQHTVTCELQYKIAHSYHQPWVTYPAPECVETPDEPVIPDEDEPVPGDEDPTPDTVTTSLPVAAAAGCEVFSGYIEFDPATDTSWIVRFWMDSGLTQNLFATHPELVGRVISWDIEPMYGQSLVFILSTEDGLQTWVISTDGRQLERIPYITGIAVTWDEDGLIRVESEFGLIELNPADLTMDISPFIGTCFEMAPDGQIVAYEYFEVTSFREMSTGTVVELGDAGEIVAWNPTGESLVFYDNDHSLVEFDFATGELNVLTDGDDLAFDPTGAPWAIVHQFDSSLWLINLETGEAIPLTENESNHLYSQPIWWSAQPCRATVDMTSFYDWFNTPAKGIAPHGADSLPALLVLAD